MPKIKSELKRKIDRIIYDSNGTDLNPCLQEDVQTLLDKKKELELEVVNLRSKLEETEETLNAIRTGAVDALIISGPAGESVYSLAGAEHPYRVMVETMGEGAVSLSQDGTILYANSSFARLIGMPLEQMIGSFFIQYIGPEHHSKFQNAIQHGRKNSQLEVSLSTRNTSKIPVYLSISTLGDENTFGYFSVIVTDLTHQKNAELLREHEWELKQEIEQRSQAQQTLQQSRNSLMTFIDSAPVGIVVADLSGRILLANSMVEIVFGEKVSGDTHTSTGGYSLLLPDGSPLSPGEWPLSQALGGSYVKDMEFIVRRADGIETVILASATPLTTNSNEVWGAITVFQDITKRKRAEEALNAANSDLEVKIRERTALLTETNNFLLVEIAERKRAEQALRKNQKLLLAEIEERKRNEKVLRSAQKNLRAMASEIIMADERSRQQFASDLHDTVIQTLGAAKLRSELLREHISKKGVQPLADLQTLLSQSIQESRQIMAELSPPVLKQFGFIPALEWLTEQVSSQNALEIEFKGNDSLEDLSHEVQVLLFQSTRELLMNIMKHSQAKKAMVSVVHKNNNIRITVKDDGIGFHGKVSFRDDYSGFGLFSIRERLKHLGGQLIIESKPSQGTRVTMVSPTRIEH